MASYKDDVELVAAEVVEMECGRTVITSKMAKAQPIDLDCVTGV